MRARGCLDASTIHSLIYRTKPNRRKTCGLPRFSQSDTALSAASCWAPSPLTRSGKTTLAKRLAEDVDGGVLFCAYTGKAASVMRARGWRRRGSPARA
jgi:hypothetical protein